MVQVGKINRLPVNSVHGHEVHLDGGKSGDIPLKGSTSRKYQIGDILDVFVYVDREQNVMATIHKPYVLMGEFAKLTAVSTSKVGAFLGWGLEDDLFVPKSEQINIMRVGQPYVVFAFLSEKTHRITASSKLEKFLNKRPPKYRVGEAVDLLIYGRSDLGYSAVVNGAHVGMIYNNEVFQKLEIGQKLQGYVKKLREDSKIDLQLQQTGYQQVDEISQNILNLIKEKGGVVGVTDKSAPEEIYAMFGVSKKIFKKSIGALYKKRLIVIEDNGITLVD
ncbi:S1 RNA-binding domain-containing protein [Desulfosediminicola flagellatus]|uniref:CvfB family protein n=1 Tax=Desulfosediminicola flagellatus TaxID=2569541 RepID=UPI0010AD5B74|nr:S1-like domain-containing RNA-binding protein [Desulfosediminicola flagellatus]